jgi:predicted nuclease with TOPRIM domain
VRERVENCYKNVVKNPYREAYLVIKGELLDLKGMSETLQGREMVVKQQSSTESKKRSDQQEMEKLQMGKTTLKSIFKSSKSKESEVTSL